MRRIETGRHARLRDLKTLLAGTLSLALLMQCGSVCLWSCLLQHASHQHYHAHGHPDHRHAPTSENCRHSVISSSSASGPSVLLATPAPAASTEHPLFAGATAYSQPEPVDLTPHPLPEPDSPPPRG